MDLYDMDKCMISTISENLKEGNEENCDLNCTLRNESTDDNTLTLNYSFNDVNMMEMSQNPFLPFSNHSNEASIINVEDTYLSIDSLDDDKIVTPLATNNGHDDAESTYDFETKSTDSDSSYRNFQDDEVFYSTDDENTLEVNTENVASSFEFSDKTTEASHSKKRKHNVKENLARKRKCEPEKWERNIKKTATNLGLAYTSSTTKQNVPAREMKIGCGPGCRFKCENKVSEEERRLFFAEYWSAGDQNKKYAFISRYVSETATNECMDQSKQQYVRTYTIRTGCQNKIVPVCRTTVNTTLNKIRKLENLEDKRGTSKNSRPKKIDETITQNVVDHINLFDRVESHYTRNDLNESIYKRACHLVKCLDCIKNGQEKMDTNWLQNIITMILLTQSLI